MKIRYKYFFLFLILSILPSCINSKKRNPEWASKITETSLANLYKLNDSLYRSEQPNKKEFLAIEKIGIKSILNLREDRSDITLLHLTHLNYEQVKIATADFGDSEIIEALKVINSAQKPLLIHCKHGSDRTGVVTAMYRIIFQNWTKQSALDELKNGGYGFHTRYDNIPEYINNFDTEYIKKMVLNQK